MVYASFCGRLTRQTRVGGSGVERPPCLCALSIGSRSKISTGSATFPLSIHPSNPLDVLKMQPDRNSIRSKTVAHITAIGEMGIWSQVKSAENEVKKRDIAGRAVGLAQTLPQPG